VAAADDNWYKHTGVLFRKPNIWTEEEGRMYVIQHYVDTLGYKEKWDILNILYERKEEGEVAMKIKEYLEIPENVDIYIMEKRKPTFDEKKNRMKSGIHIVIPSICTTSIIEQSVRRNLLKTMDNYFNNLPLQEKWDRVYDEGVIKRSANWMLYGSKKGDEEALPYMISYILNYKNNEFTIIDTIPPITSSLIKTLSVRKQKSDETPLTQKAREIYSVNNQPLISGGRAVTPSRGRPAQRGEPASRGSSPPRRRWTASSRSAGGLHCPCLRQQRRRETSR
jgi:hypothetical protein